MRPMLLLAISAFLTGITLGSPASADNEFDVNVANGLITVTAHAGWHINKDFPWKLIVGDTKLDKSKFTLEETTAKLTGAPKGNGKLKGAVCSKDQCHTFEKDVSIQ
jgi:hypothetical protein